MLRVMGDTGPAVLLLPGGAESADGFFPGIADALAESCRVILFDRPGVHGSAAEGGIADAADAIHAALAEVSASPVVVVGQSLGGAVTLLLAAAHPDDVAGIVLLDATPINDPELCDRIEARATGAARLARSPWGRRALRALLSASARGSARRHAMSAQRREAMLTMARTDLDDLSRAADGLAAAARDFDLAQVPRVPASVISGDRRAEDPVRSAHQRIADALDAPLVIWPRAEHAVHLTHADDVLDVVRSVVWRAESS